MLTKSPDAVGHLFDDATRVAAGDSRWSGHTSEDYWAFVGPFGGVTAATMLRAIMEHPQRSGDPLAFTVNFCAPIAQGPFDLDVRLIKANRSTQHWAVELTQNGAEVATFATAVFAVRRPSWSHQPALPPQAPPFEAVRPYPKSSLKMSWVKQYDFRFVEGEPQLGGAPHPEPASAFSKLWIGDTKPRPIDVLSLMSMSDAFFGRIFHVRNEFVPVRHRVADDVFSCRRRRSRGRGYHPGSRGGRRQDLSQEFWRPDRRAVVAERPAARDDHADGVFQGVGRFNLTLPSS
jgi:hypothetical protein